MDIRQKIGSRIKQAREDAGITTTTELSERSGLDRGLLYLYESGSRLPKPHTISAIAKATQVDAAWLMGLTDKKTDLNNAFVAPQGSNDIAFSPAFLETLKLDKKHLKLIKVSGNLMEPTLKEGDWVLIHTQETFLNEGLFALKVGKDVTIRRIQRNLEGGFTVLSDNKAYPPQLLSEKAAEKLEIIGKVILYCCKS